LRRLGNVSKSDEENMRLTRKLQLFLQPAKVFCDRTIELEEMDEVLGQACGLDKVLKQYQSTDLFLTVRLETIRAELETYIPRAKQVVSQAYRRVVKEEVSSSEKLVSIFEEHTDIIVKGFRDVVFGHKVMLTTGAFGLLFTLKVLEGNPKDSTLVSDTLSELQSLHGKAPTALVLPSQHSYISLAGVSKPVSNPHFENAITYRFAKTNASVRH